MITASRFFNNKILLFNCPHFFSDNIVFLQTIDTNCYLILDSFLKNKMKYDVRVTHNLIKFASTRLEEKMYNDIVSFINSNEFINHPAHIL